MNYCMCSQCAQILLFDLGISALEPDEFVRRARRYKLTSEQEKIVAEIELKSWNSWAKGEQE